jgi:hypothetical protein
MWERDALSRAIRAKMRPEAAHAEEAIAHAFGGGQLCKPSITRRGLLFEVFEVMWFSLPAPARRQRGRRAPSWLQGGSFL